MRGLSYLGRLPLSLGCLLYIVCLRETGGKTVENRFAYRIFKTAIDENREHDQRDVGEIQGSNRSIWQPLGKAIHVDQIEDIEVQQVETVGALTDQQQRSHEKMRDIV